jgi:hypothetical protein
MKVKLETTRGKQKEIQKFKNNNITRRIPENTDGIEH